MDKGLHTGGSRQLHARRHNFHVLKPTGLYATRFISIDQVHDYYFNCYSFFIIVIIIIILNQIIDIEKRKNEENRVH